MRPFAHSAKATSKPAERHESFTIGHVGRRRDEKPEVKSRMFPALGAFLAAVQMFGPLAGHLPVVPLTAPQTGAK